MLVENSGMSVNLLPGATKPNTTNKQRHHTKNLLFDPRERRLNNNTTIISCERLHVGEEHLTNNISCERLHYTLKKMKRLLVSMLFLTAVVCLTTADEQNSYNQLESRLKKFVDLAIIKANQQFSFGHLNFFEFGKNLGGHVVKEVSPRVKMDVRLMNTNCRKVNDASGHRHRPECPFKQLQVWCLVCSPDPNTNDPFIGCVRRKDARMLHNMYEEHCRPTRLHGDGSQLARTDGEAVQPGCLGCF